MNARFRAATRATGTATKGSRAAGLVSYPFLALMEGPLAYARAINQFSIGRFGRWRIDMGISQYDPAAAGRPAWNAGKQVGAKRALKVKQIWTIRFFLHRESRMRDRAIFDVAIDSKLRGCDLVKIKIGTLVSGPAVRSRSMVIQ